MTRLDRILVSAGLLMACVPPAMAALLMPRFRETFEAFGADLPILTRIIADYHAALLLMPTSVLVVALAWPKKERRGVWSLVLGSMYFFFGPILIVVATYLPIWKLGAVV